MRTLLKSSEEYGFIGYAALVFLSLLVHAVGALLASGLGLLNRPPMDLERVAKVTIAKPVEVAAEVAPPPSVAPPILRDPPEKKPEKTSSARPRESEKVVPKEKPAEVPLAN